MRARARTIDGWNRTAPWVVLGPLLCVAAALAYNTLAFAGFGPEVRFRALVAAVVVPLGLSVPGFLYFSLKLRELARANRKLGIIAATDSLTNCLNRNAFTTLVETRLNPVRWDGVRPHGALLIIDADNFKQINDRFGHQNGDEALALIAQAIRSSVRAGDSVGRLGGEEFGVFLPGVGRHAAETVAERLRGAVERLTFIANGQLHPLSVSVGGVVFDHKADFGELFRAADDRLYRAKRAGRNRICLTACTPKTGLAVVEA